MPRKGTPPPGKTAKPMSAAHESFAAHYCTNGFDARAAYKAAYPESGPKTWASRGWVLLKEPKVREEIRKLVDEHLGPIKDRLSQQIIDTLLKRAFYDPLDFVDLEGKLREDIDRGAAKGIIDAVTRKENQWSNWVELKMADRDKAIEMLAKFIELVKPAEAGDGTGTKVILLPTTMSPEQWAREFGPKGDA